MEQLMTIQNDFHLLIVFHNSISKKLPVPQQGSIIKIPLKMDLSLTDSILSGIFYFTNKINSVIFGGDYFMAKTSKKGRKLDNINQTLHRQGSKLNNIENDVQRLKKQYDEHIVSHIIDDLQKERFAGSGKPMYTYSEVADRYNTSASTVARIADEHGLNRRKKNNA
jgi:hypothetical protein